MTLAANSAGEVKGKFTIPANVPAGNKKVIAVGASGSKSESVFAGQGTLERQVFQQQNTTLNTRWQSPPPPRADSFNGSDISVADPIAETFTLLETRQLSGVNLWFVDVPTTTTRVQIRETTGGLPNLKVIAESIMTPAQILANTPPSPIPPTDPTVIKEISAVGIGSTIVPAGVTTITFTGNGTAGLAGVTGVGATYTNWMFSVAQPTGSNSPVSSILDEGEIPNNVSSIAGSFTVHGVDNHGLGIAAGEAIVFTPSFSYQASTTSQCYAGMSALGTQILLFFGRTVSTTGTTGVTAAVGSDTTATIGLTTKTFAGASSGVTTTPSPTVQTATVSGSTATLVKYNVPVGGSLVISYTVPSTSDTDNGQAAGAFGATNINFPNPVTLLAGVEYALVVLCNDTVGSLAVAELGKFDATAQRWITTQPYTVGTLLSSSNGTAWTVHQDRDLTFNLMVADFTETVKTVSLGTVAVVAATDLMLMSYSDQPSSETFTEYMLTLPDASVLTVSDGQPIQLPAAITGNVSISAKLTGSANFSPLLYPGTQLVVGKVSTTALYVSRAVPAGSAVKIKVILEGLIPSGANVTAHYRGIDPSGTWTSVPYLSDRPVDDGFSEFTYELTPITETAIQIKLTLSGTSAARPRVRDLRIIVL